MTTSIEGDPVTEPTEPRTVHGHVVDYGGGRIDVLVARDTEEYIVPGTPVVVSTVPPDGVAVAADGRMVLLPGAPLPEGWEARMWSDSRFRQIDNRGPWVRPMEVRPVPAPAPATERVPWWEAVGRTTVHGERVLAVTADHEGVTYTPELGGDQRVDDDGMVTVLRDADPNHTDTPSEPKADIVWPPGCVCVAFGDTGGFRIADLACPVHGVEGTGPGDGPWETHRTDQLTDLEDDDA